MTRWDTYLLSEFVGPILCSAGNRYPSVRACLRALDEFEAKDFVIVGMEGLATDGVHIIPSVDHIADFSSISGERHERLSRSIDAARSLLRGWQGVIDYVDVSVDEGNGSQDGP